MPQCPKCSQSSPDGSQHCVHCGAQLDPGAAHQTQLGMPILARETHNVGGHAFAPSTDPQATMPNKPSLLAGLPRPRVRSVASPLSQSRDATPPPVDPTPIPDARSTVMGMPLISIPARPAGPDQTLPQRPSVKKAPVIQTLSSFDLNPPDQGTAANTQPEVVPAQVPTRPSSARAIAAAARAASAPVKTPEQVATAPVDPIAVTQPHDRESQLAAAAMEPLPPVQTPPKAIRTESRSPTRASGPTSARIGDDAPAKAGFFAITPLKIILGLLLAGGTYLLLSNAHIELFPCTITTPEPPKTVDGVCSLLGASYPGTQLTGAGWALVGVVSGLVPLLVGFALGGLFNKRP